MRNIHSISRNCLVQEGGKTPGAGVKVQMREGHTVVHDVHTDQVIGSLHVHGTLTFTTDRDTRLDVGLIRITSGDNTGESARSNNRLAPNTRL